MTTPFLETIAASLNYTDLPEVWRVLDPERFSVEKTLYDYQRDALEKAARALFLYYGNERDWGAGESPDVNAQRKLDFSRLYTEHNFTSVQKYERRVDRDNQNENPIFRILSEFMPQHDNAIPYHNLINRMCFWMATGSGKTLVMVKLIEFIHALKKQGEIPPHNILILAPSPHLIEQIQRTVDEFNASGLYIDLVPLRNSERRRQGGLGETATVYYHRSDNISDVQKDALTDYRTYQNGGKWYVLLDEAHKGGKEDSKRQAYYAVMAREGFLFNFSATFTDEEDIVTTVKKYNLREFIINGHGKNIYLNEEEYAAFKNRMEEISHSERKKIVLKSLITLAHVSMLANELRTETGLENLYHLPLMLTLVNSVNTDIENERNDLWAFFQTLRDIASGDIDKSLFTESRDELAEDWREARLLFNRDGGGLAGMDQSAIMGMTVTDLRAAVFLSRGKGRLQFIRSGDNKELALQLTNSDSPFALIRIGDISKWRNEILAEYEETTALQEKSFFDKLYENKITILMGSRTFFESWDSNRPNVINFINIGGKDAKKFVVQSVGRGVRIETLPNKRRRLSHLLPTLDDETQTLLYSWREKAQPLETLFLFATNRAAVKNVLEGLEAEKDDSFETLDEFDLAPVPTISKAGGDEEMPLLVPEYVEANNQLSFAKFAMSEETLTRIQKWLGATSDSVLAVRDGLCAEQISALRGMLEQGDGIRISPQKEYDKIPFLQTRLMSHLCQTGKIADGVRKVDDKDIVHFRQIRVHREHAEQLREKIKQVKQGHLSDDDILKLVEQLRAKKITRDEYDEKSVGKDEDKFKELTIKKLVGHYYLPVILGNEKASYIQHIIKVGSEVAFLNALEKWVASNKAPWDAWMFSRIDESLDQIHIPYYDTGTNEYRRFMPDFVFWMCKGDQYRIVFVDPKGTTHASSYHKIDGYKHLFEKSAKDKTTRQFRYGKKWKVSVELLLFNPKQGVAGQYQQYWTDDPACIFRTK